MSDVETGLLAGGLFLALAAYGAFAIIGGGLLLARRRAVRKEVERLLRSVTREGTGVPARRSAGRSAEATGESVGRRER